MNTPPSSSSGCPFLGARGIDQATYLFGRAHAAMLSVVVLVVVGLLAWTQWRIGPALMAINAAIAIFYLVSTFYRVVLIDRSLRRQAVIEIPPEDLQVDREWPPYVIQVPLYKEPGALPHLIRSLGAIDYPKDRLTVQLLIEEDDRETREALRHYDISPPFTVVTIPVSYPRTKPKACNVGLAVARGDYLVIYDAEDRPEPDQLKKAVLAFEQSTPDIGCIQAKLNFYNTSRNLLTRCFTAEYAMWFDLCLPGLDSFRAPIPLGGTSNHFRLAILKQLAGWDEFNVTEDCDLGLRLFGGGWRTRIVESTTWEEACPWFPAWIRQRSRWVKGYVQTYLVHTRHPIALTRRLGLANSLHFHLLIGGSVISQLLAPIFWLLVVFWLTLKPATLALAAILPVYREALIGQLPRLQQAISEFFPGHIFVIAAMCLFIGNFAFIYGCAIACACRGFGQVVKFTPLMLFYWIVMSFAAWKGTLQLIWRPHYWEKTQHHAG